MASIASILVKDDHGGPAEFTFNAITDTPNPFWRTTISGVPFEGQMRLWMIEEVLKNGNTKRSVKLEIPVMETLGASGTSAGYVAPPKVAYTDQYFFTQIADRRGTSFDRANGTKIAVGILQGASAVTATGTLDQASAADAFAASTAAALQFLIYGIKPT